MVKSYIILVSAILLVSCGNSTYEVVEPKPTLEVKLLQDAYVLDEPVYVQLRASQRGFDGSFRLSAILQEGLCDIDMNGSKVPANGEWATLSNNTEILTLTPRQAGPLRLSFEIRAGESASSGRSTVNLKVAASAALQFSASAPSTHTLADPLEITVTTTKKGFSGSISVQFDQLSGAGALQYGAVAIPSGGKFSLPANSTQILYYTPTERGTHKLQLSATDGYTTEFRTLEVIITA